MIARLALAVSAALSVPLAAAQRPPEKASPEHVAAMKKVEFLAGNWKGEGWIEISPGQRHEFQGTEQVEKRLDGLILLIEGRHEGAGAAAGAPPVHHAVAILSYDPQNRHYRMQTHLAAGRSGDFKAELDGEKLIWWIDAGGRRIRYTIRLNEKGQWHEIGEMSADGEQWRQFFEMTLSRET